MYAVIRAGGKQYRVAPGDVIRVEKLGGEQKQVQFGDVLVVSGTQGELGKPQGEARVIGEIVDQAKADKVLVFHYKRKKQYKKLAGHRQPFSRVKITEIVFDGQSYKAPADHEQETKRSKPAKAAHEKSARAEHKHAAPEHAKHAHAKPASKKSSSKSGKKKK